MRDGNPHPSYKVVPEVEGFSLPMRDGNPVDVIVGHSVMIVLAYL